MADGDTVEKACKALVELEDKGATLDDVVGSETVDRGGVRRGPGEVA
jgi:hypothetical protein